MSPEMSSTRSLVSTHNQPASLTPSAPRARSCASARKWRKPLSISTLAAALALTVASVLSVQASVTDNWTGATSTDFGTGSNWNNGVPTAGIATVIDLASGNVSVISTGSYFTGSLVVGQGNNSAANQLTLQGASNLTSDSNAMLGQNGSSLGRVAVNDLSTWTVQGVTTVGGAGAGNLTVANGGLVVASGSDGNGFGLTLGASSTGNGTVLVTDVETNSSTASSIVVNGGALVVADQGNASLTVANGGNVSVSASDNNGNGILVGNSGGSNGSVTVTGAYNSTLRSTLSTNNGPTVIGGSGNGSLTINSTGQVLSSGTDGSHVSAYVGQNSGAFGTVTVDGNDGTNASTWSLARGLVVGYVGNGDVSITSQGLIDVATTGADTDGFGLTLGHEDGSVGNVTIRDEGTHQSTLQISNGAAVVGVNGAGNLSISNGGLLNSVGTDSAGVAVYIGYGVNGTGSLSVTGTDATAQLQNGSLVVGVNGAGCLTIQNQAYINVYGQDANQVAVAAGVAEGSNGTLFQNGYANLNVTNGSVIIGDSGNATAEIRGGSGLYQQATAGLDSGEAVVIAKNATSTSSVLVTDVDSILSANGGNIVVGDAGVGTLTVANGGKVSGNVDVILGSQEGAYGNISVSGTNSTVNTTNNSIVVGDAGTGELNVSNNGAVHASALYAGNSESGQGNINVTNSGYIQASSLYIGSGGNAAAVITDAGSTLNISAGNVGYSGNGSVTVSNGGYFYVDESLIVAQDGTGAVTITDSGSNLTAGSLTVGGNNTGALSIVNGASASLGGLVVGYNEASNGTVAVNDTGSQLYVNGGAQVGYSGSGLLSIANGGNVTITEGLAIGYEFGGNGTVTVDGVNSTLQAGTFYVGDDGLGALLVSNGGSVSTTDSSIYIADGSDGNVTVTNATLTTFGTLFVGYEGGNGTLTVSSGGNVWASAAQIGTYSDGPGVATVTGEGSSLTVTDDALIIGNEGNGTLNVLNGGHVELQGGNANRVALEMASGDGAAALTIDSASMYLNGAAVFGNYSNATVNITNGGSLTVDGSDESHGFGAYIGWHGGSTSTVSLSGVNSSLTLNNGALVVGNWGNGTLNIDNNATVTTNSTDNISLYLGRGRNGNGTINLADTGTTLNIGSLAIVGDEGTGNLTIYNGAFLSLSGWDEEDHSSDGATLMIGRQETGNGSVYVTGTNSTLQITDDGYATYIGVDGTGALTVANGGYFHQSGYDNANMGIYLGFNSGSNGTLTITDNNTIMNADQGSIFVGVNGNGTFNVSNGAAVTLQMENANNVGYLVAGQYSGGTGAINVDGEFTNLTIHAQEVIPTFPVPGVDQLVILGIEGAGSLSVSNGATVSITNHDNPLWLAVFDGSSGTINLSSGGRLIVESTGTYAIQTGSGNNLINFAGGTLQVKGNLSGVNAAFADETTSSISTEGTTAFWLGTSSGNGTLNIIDGGTLGLNAFNGAVGGLTVTNGTLAVDGNESETTLGVNGTVSVTASVNDTATLAVSNSGSVTIINSLDGSQPALVIADGNDTVGTVTVDTNGSLFVTNNAVVVGNGGAGSLNISNGGDVEFNGNDDNGNSLLINAGANGTGSVTVDANGTLYTQGGVVVGVANAGSLAVSNGGSAEFNGDYRADVALEIDNNSTVTVSGEGSSLTADNGGIVVANGSFTQSGGNVTVENGHLVVGTGLTNGTYDLSGGNVSVEDGNAVIGYSGNGTLNISGGTFSVGDGNVVISGTDDGNGTVNLTGGVLEAYAIMRGDNNGTALLNLNGGTLRATDDNNHFLSGFGESEVALGENGVTVDTNDYNITFGTSISGNGTLRKISTGTLTFNDFAELGGLTVNGGEVVVKDQVNVSDATNVASGWCVTASLSIICENFLGTTDLIVGGGRYSNGTVNVMGGSELDAVYASIGKKGVGALNITNGSSVYIQSIRPTIEEDAGVSMVIGAMSCGNGTVLVDGEGSSLYIYSGALVVANCGTANLTVTNGGYLKTDGSDESGTAAYVGGYNGNSGTGNVTITGSGSRWDVTGGKLIIDDGGSGYVTVSNGGKLVICGSDESGTALVIGQALACSSNLYITDFCSKVIVSGGSAIVGNGGSASVSVANGGRLVLSGSDESGNALYLGSGGSASLYVSDLTSLVTVSGGAAVVGEYSTANVSITNGASLSANGTNGYGNALVVGLQSDGNGTIHVSNVELGSNTSSTLSVDNGPAVFGLNGFGELSIENGGVTNLGGTNEAGVAAYFGKNSDGQGDLFVDGVESTTGFRSALNVYNGSLVLGDRGYANVRVTNGGYVEVSNTDENGFALVAGNRSSGNSSILISGVNLNGVDGNVSSALYVDSGAVVIAKRGEAFVTVSNGGFVGISGADSNGVGLYLGYNSCSYGNFEISGMEFCSNVTSTLQLDTGVLVIGYNGSGDMVLSAGGNLVLTTPDSNGVIAYLGYNEGSQGNLTVRDVVSSTNTSTTRSFVNGSVVVGNSGNGSLSIINGGNVSVSASDNNGFGLYAGLNQSGTGSISVLGIESESGIRSSLTVTGSPLILGYDGSGSLTVNQGGLVRSEGVDGTHVGTYLGYDAGSYGSASVYDVNSAFDTRSSWTVNRALVVGASGNADVFVSNGGQINIAVSGTDDNGVGLYIAQNSGSSASVNVQDVETDSGTASLLSLANGSLVVGNGGNGLLNVSNGGYVFVANHDNAGFGVVLGANEESAGYVTISGALQYGCSSFAQSTLQVDSAAIVVGNNGYGNLLIDTGGYVTVGTAGIALYVGANEGSGGNVVVTGIESESNTRSQLSIHDGALAVGYNGNGTLGVFSGALVEVDGQSNDGGNVGLYIGYGANATGSVSVSDYDLETEQAAQLIVSNGSVVVGYNGAGTLAVSNGGNVSITSSDENSVSLYVGQNEGSNGTLTVDGANVTTDGAAVFGDFGNATVTISNAGILTVSGSDEDHGFGAYIGWHGTSSNNTVTVTGEDSTLYINGGALVVGNWGTGTLNITNGGVVEVNEGTEGIGLYVGRGRNGNGDITVSDSFDVTEGDFTITVHSSLSVESGATVVGENGHGNLTIANGAAAFLDGRDSNEVSLYIGRSSGTGHVLVTGSNSTLEVENGTIVVDNGGHAYLDIENGGIVNADYANCFEGAGLYVGYAALDHGVVNVTDEGSVLNVTNGTLIVGYSGRANLTVSNGGTVNAGGAGLGASIGLAIGYYNDCNLVQITDSDSTLNVTNGSLVIGMNAEGHLSIENGGFANITGTNGDGQSLILGTTSDGSGYVTVTGLGSSLTVGELAAATIIGSHGYGNMSVLDSAMVNFEGVDNNGVSAYLGYYCNGEGYLFIDGGTGEAPVITPNGHVAGSTVTSDGALYVGFSGYGNVTVTNGGTLYIGGTADNGVALDLGRNEGSTGNLLVSGETSSLTVDEGSTRVGDYGSGYLTVHAATAIELNSSDDRNVALYVGRHETGYGYVYLDNGANVDVNSGMTRVGDYGNGTIFIGSGASLTQNGTDDNGIALDIGRHEGANGAIVVQDEGSTLYVGGGELLTGATIVGHSGNGSLSIYNGGYAQISGSDENSIALYVSLNESGNGSITVSDSGSQLLVGNDQGGRGALLIAQSGNGSLTVQNGGTVNLDGYDNYSYTDDGANLIIGANGGANGTVLITDNGSSLNVINEGYGIVIGDAGNGTITVANGGTLYSNGWDDSGSAITLGLTSTGVGVLTVTDANSTLSVDEGSIFVGYNGTGTMTVANGASVTIQPQDGNEGGALIIGVAQTASQGLVLVDNATLTVGGRPFHPASPAPGSNALLVVGNLGNGTLTATNGGTVIAHGGVMLGELLGSFGTVNLTNNATLEVGGEDGIAAGEGTYAFNMDGGRIRVIDNDLTTSLAISLNGCFGLPNIIDTNEYDATFSGVLSGSGTLQKEGYGSLYLANNETYTGGTNVYGGTLVVDGELGGNIGSWCVSSGDLYVGELSGESATLNILNGGRVYADEVTVASHRGDNDYVLVDGSGSRLHANDEMIIADVGNATLTVSNGGKVVGTSLEIGESCTAIGYVLVTDICSTLNLSSTLVVGDSGYGNLTVANGGNVTVGDNIAVGYSENNNSAGDILVTDTGSTLSTGSSFYIGDDGYGNLTIANGGAASSARALYAGLYSQGQVTVTDSGSNLTVGTYIELGDNGNSGYLTIQNGGSVTILANNDDNGVALSIGRGSESYGNVVITDEGSVLVADNGTVRVGDYGLGELTIANGAFVSFNGTDSRNVTLYVGRHEGSSGNVVIDNAELDIANGSVRVGDYGQGQLTVQNGGTLYLSNVDHDGTITLDIARHDGSYGNVTVDGFASSLTIENGATIVGNNGNGTLNLYNNGSVVSLGTGDGYAGAIIGFNEGGNGTVNVMGLENDECIVPAAYAAGWTIRNSALVIGHSGNGTLNITNGGQVNIYDNDGSASLYAGLNANTSATILIDGEGSALTVGSEGLTSYLGYGGNATLTVSNGGAFNQRGDFVMAYFGNSTGTATVDGEGSSLNVDSGAITVGLFGNATLNITNGGYANTTYVAVGTWANSTGSLLVDGEGSSLTVDGGMDVGYHGNGTLTVSNGGNVSVSYITSGTADTGVGSILVTDSGSLYVSTNAQIGTAGNGTLEVSNDGLVSINSTLTLGGETSTGGLTLSNSGTLEIGGINGIGIGGNYSITMDGGRIRVINSDLSTSVNITLANCFDLSNVIDTNGLNATLLGLLSGSGSLEKAGEGTLFLNNSEIYTGGTIVSEGTLWVDALLGGNIGNETQSSGDLYVGGTEADLYIVNSASVYANEVTFGSGLYNSDYIQVSDYSSLIASETLTVGDTSNATLVVSNGGFVSAPDAVFGRNSTGTGNVTVQDSNSMLSISEGALIIGLDGNATLTVANGGSANISGVGENGASISIGRDESGIGSLIVQGEESILTVDNGAVRVGDYGTGYFTISDSANVTLNGTDDRGVSLYVGRHGGSNGTVAIANATLNINDGAVRVGDYGTGDLNITDAGVLNTYGYDENGVGLYIGKHSDSNGSMEISDPNSSLFMYNGTLAIGYDGNGTVTISNGGFLGTGAGTETDVVAVIGAHEGSNGNVTITGANADFEARSTMVVVNGALAIGGSGNGTVSLYNGGSLDIIDTGLNGIGLYLGLNEGSNGSLTVDGIEETTGNRSSLTVESGAVVVGANGTADLTVQNGGRASISSDNVLGVSVYVGRNAGSQGTVVATDEGTVVNTDSSILVGFNGTGNLTVANGATMNLATEHTDIVDSGLTIAVNGTGSVLVTGVNSALNIENGDLNVGYQNVGSLTITNGGSVSAGNVVLGLFEDSEGTLSINGFCNVATLTAFGISGGDGFSAVHINGGKLIAADDNADFIVDLSCLTIGNLGATIDTEDYSVGVSSSFTGNGGLTVMGGNGTLTLTGNNTYAGDTNVNGGTLTVDGGSIYSPSADIYVGHPVTATSLNVINGGNVTADELIVASYESSNDTVTVDGEGSIITLGDTLVVGDSGNGTLNITNGGNVNVANITNPTDVTFAATIGLGEGSNGTVLVSDAGSILDVTGNLAVGGSGNGTLTVQNGGTVNATYVNIAQSSGSTGSVLVTGANSTLNAIEFMDVGEHGDANLTVANGGTVVAHSISAGAFANGTITVTDTNSTLTTSGLGLGTFGYGNLTVANGGVVNTTLLTLGIVCGNGSVLVTDLGSALNANGGLIVGEAGTADLTVANGAVLSNLGTDSDGFNLIIANATNSTGVVTLTDGGSQYNAYEGTVLVGRNGTASLYIQNGATLTSNGSDGDGIAMYLGSEEGSNGTVSVSGNGSVLQLGNGGLVIGSNGIGNLSILCGGEVDIANNSVLLVASGLNSTGTLNLNYGGTLQVGGTNAIQTGSGNAALNLNGGTLRAGANFTTSANFNLAGSTSSINTNGYTATVSGTVSGTGNLSKDGTGTLVLSGNNTYTGGTSINAGNLVVDGNLTSNVTVTTSGAVLGGNGTITGGVQVNGGGVSPGIANAVSSNVTTHFANLTINGDLTMNVTATTLAWHLSSVDTVADVLNILGNLTTSQANPTITFDFQSTGYFDGAGTPQTYTLINANNDFSSLGFQFTAINSGTSQGASALSYFIFANGGKTLEYVLVPEPATWGLILGGAMLLMGLRRKRNRQG